MYHSRRKDIPPRKLIIQVDNKQSSRIPQTSLSVVSKQSPYLPKTRLDLRNSHYTHHTERLGHFITVCTIRLFVGNRQCDHQSH